MASENLLATLENTLRQTRAARARLGTRLAEVEREAENIRAEMAEMDVLAEQTEAAMYRFMAALATKPRELSTNTQERAADTRVATPTPSPPPKVTAPESKSFTAQPLTEPPKPTALAGEEPMPVPDFERATIPQATFALLQETGAPLHVNDIYERLRAGGFVFSGQNPTISIAVSLNRNSLFRKVAPGTFALAATAV
jgi:hypothetical protein